MKFLFVSKYGDECGLAFRVQEEGNEVLLYVHDPKAKNLYKGIVPRTDNWQKEITNDTVVVFGMVGNGNEADVFRSAGCKVYGASSIADDLELKRDFGLDLADNLGIEVPESADFQDFDKAIEWVEQLARPCVIKPEKNKEGIKTFVSQSPKQMIGMLNHYRNIWKGKADFVMQEVMEGIEISSEVWCVNGIIVPNSYNNTLETKRFLNDDFGCNTGCSSSTVKFNLCPQLYDETFKKMEHWLKLHRYNGALDINCIISDGVPYFLEFTARFGYSAIYALCEGLNMDISEYLATLAEGKVPDVESSDEWLGALRVTIPPYPHADDAPDEEGIPLDLGDDFEHIWPLDVMKDGDELVCSGYDGIICEVTDSHSSLKVLWESIYDRVDILEIPECQVRTDAYENAQKRIDVLEDEGWL